VLRTKKAALSRGLLQEEEEKKKKNVAVSRSALLTGHAVKFLPLNKPTIQQFANWTTSI
jgi:hypothetical protein